MHELRTSRDLDYLMENIGERKIVMLGEASHGTHEFYTWRTAITKRCIEEKNFNFIAVEGDWPDCYRVNRYIKEYKDAGDDIHRVLETFDRWPTWMWANWEIAALAEWLKEKNKKLPAGKKTGFYGLDVYSLWDSMKSMIDYLEKEDPVSAEATKKAIHCFEPFEEDEYEYARFTLSGHSCRDAVLDLLKKIRNRSAHMDGDREAGFNIEQNAWIAVNAEKYYSVMTGFDNESWNVRDRHMMDTLERLLQFHGDDAKAIVWEHNTHIGDARATSMKQSGMVNIGQLAREKFGTDKVYLAGFATHRGTVMAGASWGAPMQELPVPPAKTGSIEAALHYFKQGDYYLFPTDEPDDLFHSKIDHRAIGVVYDPSRERSVNYVPSDLSRRYDALLFFDETKALHPIVMHPDLHKLPATYPFKL
jgi:erythromycin esterase-like protein